MPYILVDNFNRGLDSRRMNVTSPAGALVTLSDAHINRGGEIEKRKAFVSTYSLPPSGTFGMGTVGGNLYVFGDGADPGVPSGVTYQRLDHPDGSTAMTEVIHVEAFDGKLYVIAKYADGDVYHFYDGTLVDDWIAGIVRDDMTDNDGIAEHLKDLIDASSNYSATRAGAVITVTGAANTAFAISTSTENVSGGTDDQTLTDNTTQEAVATVSEVLATGSFNITAGSENTAATGSVELTGGGSGSVDGITVDGVQIMSGAESFDTDLNTTAENVKDNINAHTSSPNYTATRSGATVTISAAQSEGADPNGFAVVSSTTTITTTDVNMANGVTNAITSIKVDGVELLSGRVNFTTSSNVTAANAGTNITANTSSPDYDGSSDGTQVIITAAAGSGSTANGLIVTVGVTGSVTVDTPVDMAGGEDAVTGQPQISTLTVGGTFEVGDRFTAVLGTSPNDETFGHAGNPDTVAEFVLAYQSKMYALYDSIVAFSKINDSTQWHSDDNGAGFTNMASQAAGSEEMIAAQPYFNNLAFFSRRTIQVWFVDADPASNSQIQVLSATGTFAAKSVRGFGDQDVFYLSDSGIRSLRARDSSNSAFVNDVGTAIDDLIASDFESLTDAQKEDALSVIEPIDGRYWLHVAGKIYVFSFFPASSISAWSTYSPGFTVDDMVAVDNKVYARSGDTIYLYGGSAGTTYDTTQAIATLPFLDGDDPATFKNITGIDIAAEGVWTIEQATDPNQPTQFETVGTTVDTSFAEQAVASVGRSTHVALRLTSAADASAAKIGKIGIHFNKDKAS